MTPPPDDGRPSPDDVRPSPVDVTTLLETPALVTTPMDDVTGAVMTAPVRAPPPLVPPLESAPVLCDIVPTLPAPLEPTALVTVPAPLVEAIGMLGSAAGTPAGVPGFEDTGDDTGDTPGDDPAGGGTVVAGGGAVTPDPGA